MRVRARAHGAWPRAQAHACTWQRKHGQVQVDGTCHLACGPFATSGAIGASGASGNVRMLSSSHAKGSVMGAAHASSAAAAQARFLTSKVNPSNTHNTNAGGFGGTSAPPPPLPTLRAAEQSSWVRWKLSGVGVRLFARCLLRGSPWLGRRRAHLPPHARGGRMSGQAAGGGGGGDRRGEGPN